MSRFFFVQGSNLAHIGDAEIGNSVCNMMMHYGAPLAKFATCVECIAKFTRWQYENRGRVGWINYRWEAIRAVDAA